MSLRIGCLPLDRCSSTKVHQLHSRGSTIPKFSFNFCPFDEIPNKKSQEKPLIDLIGVISSVGPFDFASPLSQKKNRKIHIRNLEEQTQEIVLWGELDESFNKELVLQKAAHGKVIPIFVGLAAGSYTGNLEASSTSTTEIYIDLELPEVDNFRNRFLFLTYAATNTNRNTHSNLTVDTSQNHNSQDSLEGTSTSSTTTTDNEEPAAEKSKQAHNSTESGN